MTTVTVDEIAALAEQAKTSKKRASELATENEQLKRQCWAIPDLEARTLKAEAEAKEAVKARKQADHDRTRALQAVEAAEARADQLDSVLEAQQVAAQERLAQLDRLRGENELLTVERESLVANLDAARSRNEKLEALAAALVVASDADKEVGRLLKSL